ncbi:(2Fe-2S)-binding protein [Thalassoroseus pseudoceratinae]|uniref:(2Fe-2S)-binding protein n=1 Tax=Thalassoroseus pseudoceratinae TaxID=2713176 RepID=UPI001421FDED|nr:(2Fe-2S)-binding protein [Thalassoroseus pseudoceratinae]
MSHHSDKLICHCLGVTESEVRGAISTGMVRTVGCVMNSTGAGTGCMGCRRRIGAMLATSQAHAATTSHSAGPPVCVLR